MPDQNKIIAYRLREAEQLGHEFSTCSRRKVGAVLVSANNRIISEGYNGAPPGVGHCTDGFCPRGKFTHEEIPKDADYNQFPCIAVHAEGNAIVRAGHERTKGGTLYVSEKPCQQCDNIIRAAEIAYVYYPDPERPWSWIERQYCGDGTVVHTRGPAGDAGDSRQ